MKKLSQLEIQNEKNVYDTHFQTIHNGCDYMHDNGYSHGGWQMVARNALMLRHIYHYLRVISKELNIDIAKIENDYCGVSNPKLALSKTTSPKEESYMPLSEACYQLSSEGYDIQWDPSQIRLYMIRHPSSFNEHTFIYSPGPGKKEISKYRVKKQQLLEDMQKFPYQSAAQKKLINNFIEWRKSKT